MLDLQSEKLDKGLPCSAYLLSHADIWILLRRAAVIPPTRLGGLKRRFRVWLIEGA